MAKRKILGESVEDEIKRVQESRECAWEDEEEFCDEGDSE